MSGVPAPTSRNAPCPCGSGRRYKECHGALANAPASDLPAALDALMPAALSAQQQGRLDEAARLYERALAIDSSNFDALHMLGVVHLQRHEYERAAMLIAAARAIRPDEPSARHNEFLVEDARWRLRSVGRYLRWISEVEAPLRAARASPLRAAAARADAPRFSVLLPTYNSPRSLLAACLDSVLAQVWPHWELCIADDASTTPETRETLRAYAAREPRIRLVERSVNGHISAATNSALALATAPFVALLDHDDLLTADALAEIAVAILERPGAAILYSDEDKVDERGERFEPYFKPDWNPVLALAQNCVSHLGVYRADLVRDVGGFREGFEGAQDWDLLLRCAERVERGAIVHVPRVLYHWRSTTASTASSMDAKSYAAAAQEKAVGGAMERRGVHVALRRVGHGAFLQADPELPARPKVTAILLHGAGEDAGGVLRRWRDALPGSVECATLEVAAAGIAHVSPASTLVLVPSEAERINAEVSRSSADVVLILASGMTPVASEWLTWLAGHALQPGTGVVAGETSDSDGRFASGPCVVDAVSIATTSYYGRPPTHADMGGRRFLVQNVAAARLDALAVRRSSWLSVGGLDVVNLSAAFRDVDLCLRLAEAGLATVWHPGVAFVRDGRLPTTPGAGARPIPEADRAYMRRRHASALAADGAYNPNLAPPPRLFELALPGDVVA